MISPAQGFFARLLTIPCSRHDTGENDPRVRTFLGLIAGRWAELSINQVIEHYEFLFSILRLHDHKGQLIVLTSRSMPAWIETLWQETWNFLDPWPVAIDPMAPDDGRWHDIWHQRRFESDWQAIPLN